MRAERLLLLSVLAGALLVLVRCIPLLATPYQIDYGEGLVLEGALRVRHAQALYPDPFGYPIVLHVYGPVAYAATAAVLPNGNPSFPAGRMLFLGCNVVIALLLGVSLRRLTGSWWIGLGCGFLLWTLPAFRFWIYLLRADVIGMALSAAGIAIYVWKEKAWYWSVLFFGLAIFCKYSLLAAPVAVFIHLIAHRKFKKAASFAGALGLACAVAMVVLQERTGNWFAFHMFSTHPDRYSLKQFFALMTLVWAGAPVATALAVWYVVQDLRGRVRSFPAIYFVVSAITALTAGKLGSTTNHFVEWMAAMCLCAGLGYTWLQEKFPERALPVAVLLGVSVAAGVAAQNRGDVQPSRQLAECGQLYQAVKNSPSNSILSQSLGPVLAAGKPVLVSDPFVYGQFEQRGLWPNGDIERRVQGKEFGMILLASDPSAMKGPDAWAGSLVDAIDKNYRVVNRFVCRDAGVVLEPRPPDERLDRPGLLSK
ncbi:MAG: hypothetical protein HY010_00195 [Acidobacteria bacterium]|nr:hypothetical protein [Acidobacteriota bacterium]